MIEIAKIKAGLQATVSKKTKISGIWRVIQAADTPTRTGNGSRQRAEKLSDDKNRTKKDWFVSDGPEKLSGKKAKRGRLWPEEGSN